MYHTKQGTQLERCKSNPNAVKYLLTILILTTAMTTQLLFDFNKDSNLKSWRIIDDGVMGGRSNGSFGLTSDGYGVFEGHVSLENNGGFSSVRHEFAQVGVEEKTNVTIRLKGDGKVYQFRVKADSGKEYSYIITFQTSGQWETIEIPLSTMYPSYRGRKLDRPNFAHQHIEEIVFLIGNGKAENFKLMIDKIELN